MLEWIESNWIAIAGTVAGTAALFVAGLIAVRAAVVRLPADYLSAQYQSPRRSRAWRVGKNVLGAMLVVAGVAMLMLPGPGILVVVLGLMLVDFPGRHRLIAWIVSRERVLNSINKVRRRHGKPDLEPPEPAAGRA